MDALTRIRSLAAAALAPLRDVSSGTTIVSALALLVILILGWSWHAQRQRTAGRPSQPPSSTTATSTKDGAAGHPDGVASLFPPSRRSHVRSLLQADDRSAVTPDAVSSDLLQRRALPTTGSPPRPQHGTAARSDTYYSPTGVALEEIRALVGSFPDYAVLSGVPPPTPCPAAFDLGRARFRPYRPFRWRYHQHMALMKLHPDYWLELEHGYAASLAARRQLLAEHGDRVLFCAPAAALACRELLEMALQFLCARYPHLFAVETPPPPAARVLVNRVLGTRTPLPGTGDDGDDDDDGDSADEDASHACSAALRILFAHVPEDFAVMLRSERDGRYYLRAAAVCSAVGWHVGQHRDQPLPAIHAAVTDYAAKMARSMDRYFARLPTDQPVQRCSWSLEDWAPLFCPEPAQRSASGGGGASPCPDPDNLRLRCDWQTLRRLPLTGAVVFNFKPVFTPLAQLRTEPRVPALLHRVLSDGDPRLVTPGKCLPHVRAAALPALAAWAAEQVRGGLVPADWEPRTLDESPFYPGWEARWHAMQGF